ncbi:MAG: YggT family protein [Armatimonadota bacterium]
MGPIHGILSLVFYVLWVMILVNVVLSWIPTAQWHPLGRFLLAVTEPLLKPFRRLIPPVRISDNVGLDLTPIIAIAVLYVAYLIVFNLIPRGL